MASHRQEVKGRRPPPRPKMPVDYIPTPIRTVAPTDALEQLMNEEQKLAATVMVHSVPRERFRSFSQLAPPSPTPSRSGKISSSSKRSTLKAAARQSFTKGLDLGRATLEKTRPAVEAAVSVSKKAVAVTANNLSQIATKTNVNEVKGESLSRSSSSSTRRHWELHDSKRLPKLKIPDVKTAVEEALNSACSTDTTKSPQFLFCEASPTSGHLRHEVFRDDYHSEDVIAEFKNMLSARRRVRKSKFGADVKRYRIARPNWDTWRLKGQDVNQEDSELLKRLTDALQEQKDYATRLIQKNPSRYPGFQYVSQPGCTLKMYWQHKSTYK
ncbi:hypothetical protein HD806DRAFT_476052 [Xylariaceae sp. AK1471]|nr:hypothetical protein HD806DRAFT_476052 [Xylariaceae sp. AK1471]